MKTVVILAAGEGTKMWPYAEIRPKAMLPVVNKPVIGHQVEMLESLGFDHILIAAGPMHEQMIHYFRNQPKVRIVELNNSSKGTASSLAALKSYIEETSFLVLYGDTLLEQSDVERLIKCAEADREPSQLHSPVTVLVAPLGKEPSQEWIGCAVEQGHVTSILGHARHGVTHQFCAFACRTEFLHYAESNGGLFMDVQVGMMPPLESYLEMSVADCIRDGYQVAAVITEGIFFDLDKPWQLLEANQSMAAKLCGELNDNDLGEGASIDPTALIKGHVKLGAGSRIGRNVVIEGNLIVGERTVIDNGAILMGNHVIGNDTHLTNYCYIAECTVIGNRCVVNHCAELDGLIMDTVYLYHYMEFYGVIGHCTDLGAATVCGTLRFDDGSTTSMVNGRRETPRNHANAVFLGDFVRTGVNAILMPGCKVGVYSVIGSGVLLESDIPNRTLIQVKQELIRKEWGPHKYGW